MQMMPVADLAKGATTAHRNFGVYGIRVKPAKVQVITSLMAYDRINMGLLRLVYSNVLKHQDMGENLLYL